MAAAHRAPKQWCLTKSETINSFENWRSNLVYVLSLDTNFTPFIGDQSTWQKKTAAAPNRGLQNDNVDVPEATRRTAVQKVASLDLMLGQIANFCPIISRNRIVKNSTSLKDIWQAIRLHYGFQTTGAYFLDIVNIKLEAGEKPEDLFQRLTAAVEDNLLTSECGISHHGEAVVVDEETTPSLENFIVLTWLRLLHPELPGLVKQRYGTELRSKTLASIKPEISLALASLLDELQNTENIKSLRLSNAKYPERRSQARSQTPSKVCPLCKQAGRPKFDHFLSACPHLPAQDKRYLVRSRTIGVDDDEGDEEDPEILCAPQDLDIPQISRVTVRASPYLEAFHEHIPLRVLLDSGAESSMIRADEAERLGLKIAPNTSQIPSQADGGHMSGVIGECKATFFYKQLPLYFDALVVKSLASPIIAGNPFLEANRFSIDFNKRIIHLRDGSVCSYVPTKKSSSPNVNFIATKSNVVRVPSRSSTLLPGQFVELQVPQDLSSFPDIVLEPRFDTLQGIQDSLPSTNVYRNVGGYIRVPNVSTVPIFLNKNSHLFNAVPVVPSEDYPFVCPESTVLPPPPSCAPRTYYSDLINLDPDNNLDDTQRIKMTHLIRQYDKVFNPDIPGYNGALGPYHAIVNLGSVQPPQRKGRLPLYGRNRLVDLQLALDDLEAKGVLATPEASGTVVEYLNPAFLVNKPSGGHRLVTAFTEVAKYCKPQPSLLPDVNQVLRQIASWKYIIVSDLTSAYHQIPLHPESRKYCGIVTPFRGIRVYCRSAMGMPGSETALEELLSRVLGDLVMNGQVAKLADDLYCGGNSYNELLSNWESVLEALHKCDLRLSASKTIVCPTATTILGWKWNQGEITASNHSLCALAACTPPPTVTALRSFIGSYKALSRVIPGTSALLGPLDDIAAGCSPGTLIHWTDENLAAFKQAQKGLDSHQAVVLPRPDDELWLLTDAAVRPAGLGATLYVRRGETVRVAGFFSCKLKKHQRNWLPCELEALAISTALKYFKAYFVQSTKQAYLLTDSKPCVEAVGKLRRGQFSNSPRVSTFLSTVSQFAVTVMHLKGSHNLPTDFASRNCVECFDPQCQICTFVAQTSEEPVVNAISQGTTPELDSPIYTSRASWRNIQSECPSLRRVFAHLRQGTRPSKKDSSIRDVKSYLSHVTIASDGLLIVPTKDTFGVSRDRIVIPRHVSHGLATAIHLRLGHPSQHQLKVVFARYFFILGMESVVRQVTEACDQCLSLRNRSAVPPSFTTQPPPEVVLSTFAADVMKRAKQLILVLRECSTSYTSAVHIADEKASSLRDALLTLCTPLRLLDGPPAIVRCDPAPGFQSLQEDSILRQGRIQLEIGEAKNPNKNPVAERAIQELREELRKLDPREQPVTATELALSISSLNAKIRGQGISSREFLFQRDQFSGVQIPLSDSTLLDEQHSNRLSNHRPSVKAKFPKHHIPPQETVPSISVGDLVYIKSDRDKSRARDRYLVTAIERQFVYVSKFVGSQLRSKSYKVHHSDCYLVPSQVPPVLRHCDPSDSDSDEDIVPTADAPLLRAQPPIDPTPILPELLPETIDPATSPVTQPIPPPTNLPQPIPPPTNLPQFPAPLRQSSRQRKVPAYLKDYDIDY